MPPATSAFVFRAGRCAVGAALVALALGVSGCGRSGATENLLSGRAPSRVSRVDNTRALTDGVASLAGGDWDSADAAIFASPEAYVEFDLGRSTPLRGAFVQGDNNDAYVLSTSEDGTTFVPLWTAGRVPAGGLQDRWSSALAGHGRWVRLATGEGDDARSVSEVQLFAEPPTPMPPTGIRRARAESRSAHVRTTLCFFIAAVALFLVVTGAKGRRWVNVLAAFLPLAAAVMVARALALAWPVGGREVAFVRAAAGTVALLACVRRGLASRRWPPHPWATSATLGVAALLGFAAFYNLGRGQFFDEARGRETFVHVDDMRIYQPFVRYFDELRYDGVYAASVLAYAEDHAKGNLDGLGDVRFRSLRDHTERPVREQRDEIRGVRERFTASRWRELKEDLRYFEDAFGSRFLTSLTDHGANATPVWVMVARIFLGHARASERLLFATGLIDGVLLLLMALAIARTFGLRTAFLVLTVFGATDLALTGTNWAGATLRHDWLALLGFGACALKAERWILAGMLLGLAAMLRAFPAVALVGVALPLAWGGAEEALHAARERHVPRWGRLFGGAGDGADEDGARASAVRVLAAAAACVVALFLLTSALYAFGSWARWWQKIGMLNAEFATNEISLRALVVGAGAPSAALDARHPLLIAAQLACLASVALAARRRPLHEAMLLALPLVWVLSAPANYYGHFICLLPLLGADRADAPGVAHPRRLSVVDVSVPLLAFCVAGYWAFLDPDDYRHFQIETAMLFVALAWVYRAAVRGWSGGVEGASPVG